MSRTWMIYGANGYTGRLAARVANDRVSGQFWPAAMPNPSGRSPTNSGFESRVFDLPTRCRCNESARRRGGVALRGSVLRHQQADARRVPARRNALSRHHRRNRGVRRHSLAQPGNQGRRHRRHSGVGFDVVPTDCLAAMLKRELPSATHLKLAFKARNGKLSPGTAKTMVEGLPEGGTDSRDGRIVKVPPAYKVETIPFTETALGPCSHDFVGRCRRPRTTPPGFPTSKSSSARPKSRSRR